MDRGLLLSEALIRHDKWLEKKGIKNTNFAIVTWSDWDCRVMLESECRYKNIKKPSYFNRYIHTLSDMKSFFILIQDQSNSMSMFFLFDTYSRWINLKLPFHEVFGGARCNLKEAVEKSGLTWEGRAHCGLDDAKNTARLLALLMRKGFKFSITNSLDCQSSDDDDAFTVSQTPQAQKTEQQPQQQLRLCYCGVKSSKGVIRKPGPKQGSVFFGCGKWTAARGALCEYFEWASL